jgi:hypothetical protein
MAAVVEAMEPVEVMQLPKLLAILGHLVINQ